MWLIRNPLFKPNFGNEIVITRKISEIHRKEAVVKWQQLLQELAIFHADTKVSTLLYPGGQVNSKWTHEWNF